MRKIDKNKMIYWQSYKEGNYEYFLEYTIVKTPMWVFKMLSSIAKFFEKLKWMTTERYEAEWETRHERAVSSDKER